MELWIIVDKRNASPIDEVSGVFLNFPAHVAAVESISQHWVSVV